MKRSVFLERLGITLFFSGLSVNNVFSKEKKMKKDNKKVMYWLLTGCALIFIMVIVGGVIPKQDYQYLFDAGAVAVFGPGTKISDAAIKILEILID